MSRKAENITLNLECTFSAEILHRQKWRQTQVLLHVSLPYTECYTWRFQQLCSCNCLWSTVLYTKKYLNTVQRWSYQCIYGTTDWNYSIKGKELCGPFILTPNALYHTTQTEATNHNIHAVSITSIWDIFKEVRVSLLYCLLVKIDI